MPAEPVTQPTATRRPLTAAEQALVEEANRRWLRGRESLKSSPWELGAPGIALLLIGGVLWALGIQFGAFIAVPGLLMLVGAGALALKNRSQKPGPAPHSATTAAVEYLMEPRRVVFTVDDRGDGQVYALFELTPGHWHLLVDEMLPWREDLLTVLASRKLRWSETDSGLPLTIRGEGGAIPRHGIVEDTQEGIEQAIARGFCWSPEDVEDSMLAEELPPWMTDWDLDPPPVA